MGESCYESAPGSLVVGEPEPASAAWSHRTVINGTQDRDLATAAHAAGEDISADGCGQTGTASSQSISLLFAGSIDIRERSVDNRSPAIRDFWYCISENDMIARLGGGDSCAAQPAVFALFKDATAKRASGIPCVTMQHVLSCAPIALVRYALGKTENRIRKHSLPKDVPFRRCTMQYIVLVLVHYVPVYKHRCS